MRCFRFFPIAIFQCALALVVVFVIGLSRVEAAGFAKGEFVRLTRSETLLFKGENFLGAPKGQEFSVLQHDAAHGLVYVSFYKEDGTLIAVTLPADALEASPPDAWSDLLRGADAMREQRFDEGRRLLAAAAQDAQYKPLAVAISSRVNAALLSAGQARTGAGRQSFTAAIESMRAAAEQIGKLGFLCIALRLDETADRLAAQALDPAAGAAPASKLDREELATRVTTSDRAVVRARQALALHRTYEASKIIEEGLKAEPARPELKAWQPRVEKDLEEAQSRYEAADSMRKHVGGVVHALTAIEHGLKAAADYPKLIALRKEMNGEFEERTSPPVTPAFLAAAKVSTPRPALEEGHKLYTTRCTECHDLELLDSRGLSGWQKAVASMSRRAHLDDTEQARIIDYIAAAQNTVDSGAK